MRDIFPTNKSWLIQSRLVCFLFVFFLVFPKFVFSEESRIFVETTLDEVSSDHVFDSRLKKEWKSAIFLKKIRVEHDSNHEWFLVKLPSKPKTHSGYCGSGTEDYIYLTSLINKKTSYSDKFLLRSCLLSIEVNNNEELSETMEGVKTYKNGFFFRQMFPFDEKNCQPIKELTLESFKNRILKNSVEINSCEN